MPTDQQYDIAVIGGGLAGLCFSILMRRKGYSVILFEKESYPFTKVCGEYISMESYDFLQRLGIPLDEMDLPVIDQLTLTSPSGKKIEQSLPLGGFGISRYFLDNELMKLAVQLGVVVHEKCKVFSAEFVNDAFRIEATVGKFSARICCGAYGKRSNLDVAWKRPFIKAQKKGLNNYVGIKYHVEADLPENQIALHNFSDGYCGISKVEGNKYCLCYLTTAANLKASGNNIQHMEENILSENPFLRSIFPSVKKLDAQPVTISQVSFEQKSQVENHIVLLGDAAGMITPLCGNGMSMAMHSAHIFQQMAGDFLAGKISRTEMEKQYSDSWKKEFSQRLRMGRTIQRFFGKKSTTNLFISVLGRFPFLVRQIIRSTHGKPF